MIINDTEEVLIWLLYPKCHICAIYAVPVRTLRLSLKTELNYIWKTSRIKDVLLCFEFGHFPNMLRKYSKVVFSIRLMYILWLSADKRRTSSSTSYIVFQNTITIAIVKLKISFRWIKRSVRLHLWMIFHQIHFSSIPRPHGNSNVSSLSYISVTDHFSTNPLELYKNG